MKYALPSQQRLRQLFIYDGESGVMYNRIARGRVKPGAISGTKGKKYWCASVDGRIYFLHHIIWKYFYGDDPIGQIDHVNQDKYDNRINNLRLAVGNQNYGNCGIRSHNTSGYKGVFAGKRGKGWRAAISQKGRYVGLGTYKTKEDAAKAYNKAAVAWFGEFASINNV